MTFLMAVLTVIFYVFNSLAFYCIGLTHGVWKESRMDVILGISATFIFLGGIAFIFFVNNQ